MSRNSKGLFHIYGNLRNGGNQNAEETETQGDRNLVGAL